MASGNTLLIYNAYSMTPTSSDPAEFTSRNTHPLYAFDKVTSEFVDVEGVIPQTYATGGIDLYLHYCCVATSGGTYWKAKFDRIDSVQDIDADTWGTSVGADSTVSGTSGIMSVVKISFANGAATDSIVAGDAFRCRICRVTDNSYDTADGDAQLYMIELRET